jgi:superfamily II DNA/RNA helicase
VACPGRLGDLLERGSIRLDAIEIVIIDEADRMADMGFLPDVRRILDLTPANRQTLLFSATLDGDIDVLVRRYQHDPARHELEVDEDDASAAVHLFWRVSSGDRVETTADITAASGPTIVFCRTKHSTDRIARQLEQRGVRAAAIHGDRSQKQREKALESFIRGSVDALVATDVAARGIHVDGVNAVVHFDPPAWWSAW